MQIQEQKQLYSSGSSYQDKSKSARIMYYSIGFLEI